MEHFFQDQHKHESAEMTFFMWREVIKIVVFKDG